MAEKGVAAARGRFVRRRVLGWLRAVRLRLLLLGMLLLLALGAWAVLVSTWLGVREVSVTGAQHLSAEQLRQAAGIVPGTPLARLDTSVVASRVEAVPGVADVDVDRSWPHGVRITVTESRPVAVVLEDGSFFAMDETGVLFRTLSKAPERLPLVRADSLAPEGRDAALAQVADVVGSLSPDIARRVDHVEVSSADSILLELRDGDQVRWGSAESSQQKAAVLAALLQIPATVYDVSVPEQPTTAS